MFLAHLPSVAVMALDRRVLKEGDILCELYADTCSDVSDDSKGEFLDSRQLALRPSLTGGGRSVGIVRSRTEAMEFSLIVTVTSQQLVHIKNFNPLL
jgi:hypothetical protein